MPSDTPPSDFAPPDDCFSSSCWCSYIASRVATLAEGSCLGEFVWNRGGGWQGKPWTPDLLTDSALVFYLFASYLQVRPLSPRFYCSG